MAVVAAREQRSEQAVRAGARLSHARSERFYRSAIPSVIMRVLVWGLACWLCALSASAEPVRRIVSLAPHVTELLFAAGAGPYVVGVLEYSDYPSAAKQIPRVGDNRALDLERIVALKPDLVVAWPYGYGAGHLDALRKLGLKVALSDAHQFEDIAREIERYGELAGT